MMKLSKFIVTSLKEIFIALIICITVYLVVDMLVIEPFQWVYPEGQVCIIFEETDYCHIKEK